MAHHRPSGACLFDSCLELPGTALGFPFGPQPAVFKVGGKIFVFFTGPDGRMDIEAGSAGGPALQPDRMSVKCDPEFAEALVRDHSAITPGYHLNKRHWVSVDLDADLPEGLAEELLVDSYDLVVHSLPRDRRPLGLPAQSFPVRPGSGTASPDPRASARRRPPG